MLVSSICVCVGQLLWKLSAAQGIIVMLAGFCFYGVGALVMIIAYKYGKLSVLQPMLSLNYVLSIFLAAVVLKEQITLLKSIGVLIIIAGVILIALCGWLLISSVSGDQYLGTEMVGLFSGFAINFADIYMDDGTGIFNPERKNHKKEDRRCDFNTDWCGLCFYVGSLAFPYFFTIFNKWRGNFDNEERKRQCHCTSADRGISCIVSWTGYFI